jgi:hypothetical protein
MPASVCALVTAAPIAVTVSSDVGGHPAISGSPPDVEALLQHLDNLYRSKNSIARIQIDVTSPRSTRPPRMVGGLIFADASLGLLWPFAAMHQREVLAAGGATWSDTAHVVLGGVTGCRAVTDRNPAGRAATCVAHLGSRFPSVKRGYFAVGGAS